jgi:hypothetical protein
MILSSNLHHDNIQCGINELNSKKVTLLKRYSHTQRWKTKIDNYFSINLVSVPPLEENLGDAHYKICVDVTTKEQITTVIYPTIIF